MMRQQRACAAPDGADARGPLIARLCRLLAVLLLPALMAACGVSDNVFILLEDADGSVGRIEVANAQGSQVVDQAGVGVGVATADSAPAAPEPVDQAAIDRIFGAALTAEPEAPAIFVLNFRSGGVNLTPASEALLPLVLAEVERRESPNVAVVGHTDTQSGAQFNARLALRRAERLRDILVDAGLDPNLIEVGSHGEANLLVPTPDNVAEPRNRRVEITIR